MPVVKTQKATPSHSPSMFANTVVVWTNPHKKICSNTKSEKGFYRKLHCPACAILNNMLCRFGIHVQGKLVRCAFFRHTRARENTFFLRNKKDVSEETSFLILHFQYNFRNLIWGKKGGVHLDCLSEQTLFLSFDTALHHIGKTQTLLHVLLQTVYKLVLLTRKTNFHNVAGRLQS